ncbi:MAG TPA: hypothetical protein VIJ71_04980 [Mycobacteriales bacterium]
MDVPPPAVAFDVSRSLHALAQSVEGITTALDATILGLRRDWHGPAANAAATLLAGLLDGATTTTTALDQAASTWDHLGHELQTVHRKIEIVEIANEIANAVSLASLLQLGLDPATDAGAVAARAGASAGLTATRSFLRETLERAVARAAGDRATLMATTIVGSYVVRSVLAQSAESGFAGQFEYGSVPWARLVAPRQLIADLIPRELTALVELGHTDLALRAPVPPSFPDRTSFDAARTAAGTWSARSIGGAQVSIEEGPRGSVQLTIHGASVPLKAGRAYSVAEVESLDVDLARTLDEIGVYADAPVTVVAER